MHFIDKTREDLAAIISIDLRKPVSTSEVDERLIHWLELKNRQLPAARWKVVKSREFLANPFTATYAAGLRLIESNFDNGVSNRAHQSRSVNKTAYRDLLFNDWGTHHFHLSDRFDQRRDGLCNNTSPVLFAYFDDDTVYFIDILEHGDRDVWARDHLVKVLASNWPNLARSFELKGVIPAKSRSSSERIDLRKAGVASVVDIDGIAYAPFGLGLTTDGGSARFTLKQCIY